MRGGTTIQQIKYDVVDNLTKEWFTRPNVGNSGGGDRFVYDDFHRVSQSWAGLDQASMTAALSDQSSTFKERTKYTLDTAHNRQLADHADKSTGNLTQFNRIYQGGESRYDVIDPGFLAPAPDNLIYDKRGNLITDGWFYYVYDIHNRLSEIYSIDPCGWARLGRADG